MTGIPQPTISNWSKKYRMTRTVNWKKGSGRMKIINDRTSNRIIRWITSGKCNNCVEIQRELKNEGINVSRDTVSTTLKSKGWIPVVKKKRQFLTTKHRNERLDFAKKYQHWTVNDWSKVIFSDETKVNRLGSDGIRYVWKRIGDTIENNERLTQSVSQFGGGSIMVWSCFGVRGVGLVVTNNETINSNLYTLIMKENM